MARSTLKKNQSGGVVPSSVQQMIPLARCIMLRRNPQHLTPHQMDALKASIQRDGFLAPVLVRPLRGGRFEVVSGNHRVMAARELGYTELPAVIAKLDDRRSKRIALNLNTVHGDPSAELMAPFLAELDDELLRDIHLEDGLVRQIMEFDATLASRLAELVPPPGYNRGSPQGDVPNCVCPTCGRRHVKGEKSNGKG